MCVTCHDPSQLSVLPLAVEAFTARDGARYMLRSRFFPTPAACDVPIRGASRRNIAMTFGVKKDRTRFGYSTVK